MPDAIARCGTLVRRDDGAVESFLQGLLAHPPAPGREAARSDAIFSVLPFVPPSALTARARLYMLQHDAEVRLVFAPRGRT